MNNTKLTNIVPVDLGTSHIIATHRTELVPQLVVTHDNMGFDIADAAVYHDHIKNGLIYITHFTCKTDEFLNATDSILKTYSIHSNFDFSRSNLNKDYKMVGSRVAIYAQGDYNKLRGVFFSKNLEDCHDIWSTITAQSSVTDELEVCLTSLSQCGQDMLRTVRVFGASDLEYVSEKYYPYLNVENLFTQFFTGSENILLLTGDPGLGKSKLATLAMRYCLENPEISPYEKSIHDDPYLNVVIAKGSDILGFEEFWLNLEEDAPDFVLVDDLDNMLTSRETDVASSEDVLKNKFIQQFLAFTDGIEKRNTKFIITTNQNYKDIDSAILREGRLFDILEMRELTADEANDIWQSEGLDGSPFNKSVTSAHVGSLITKQKNTRSTVKPYTYEDSISKITQATKKKRISL